MPLGFVRQVQPNYRFLKHQEANLVVDRQLTAALMVRLPERASWSLSVGEQTGKGQNRRGLVKELAAA